MPSLMLTNQKLMKKAKNPTPLQKKVSFLINEESLNFSAKGGSKSQYFLSHNPSRWCTNTE